MSGSVPGYNVFYVERDALGHENTHRLREELNRRTPRAPTIVVDSYKDVFNRPGQSFQQQKGRPALIAALAGRPRLYEVPARACGVHDLPLYYTDQLRNCVYNCDYCFLQGMHPSGHTLVFVDDETFHLAARERLERGPFWLSISYLTDIAAFDSVLPLTRRWVEVARQSPEMTVEVRTKGDASQLLDGEPCANVVLVWTLSPPAIANRFEHGAPTFRRRVRAAERAIRLGWRVRVALDPVVLVEGWRRAYDEMIEELFSTVAPETLEAASYGVFRMGKDFIRVAHARGDSPILHHPFARAGSLVTYTPAEIEAVHEVIGEKLRCRLGEDRVTFVHE